VFTSNVTLASEYVRSHGRTAGDVIKRMPVVDDDRLVGIVSHGNLVQRSVPSPTGTPRLRTMTDGFGIR